MNFVPSASQPRPGALEAMSCVKRLLNQEKRSILAALHTSCDVGIRCADVNFNPPKVLVSNSVNEIAHCGVDASRTDMVSIIIGTHSLKGLFFCHVFKCSGNAMAVEITRTIADVCTQCFKTFRAGLPKPGPSSSSLASSGSLGNQVVSKEVNARRLKYRQASLKAHGGSDISLVRAKITDSWFQPTMTAQDVSANLRLGRLGDFLVRESSSKLGDYAISVQTGQNIWTGLILGCAQGFQLGNTDAPLFDELEELISYYASINFMEDDMGFPLKLNLTEAVAAIDPADLFPVTENDPFVVGYKAPAQPKAASHKATFKNPPIFEDNPKPYVPSCGWPDDLPNSPEPVDPERENYFNRIRSTSVPDTPGTPGFVIDENMSEREAFEKFMDSDLARGDIEYSVIEEDELECNESSTEVAIQHLSKAYDNATRSIEPSLNIQEIDSALSALRCVKESLDELLGEQFDSGSQTLQTFSEKIFQNCQKDADNLVSGIEIRPILLKSGLSPKILGAIWKEVDHSHRGKIDCGQLGLILGLISMAQNGKAPVLVELEPEKIAPPTFSL